MEQAHKTPSKQDEEEVQQDLPNSADAAHKEALDGEVDDLLADIDDVLESNAEAFVNAYIQKGGE